MEALIIDTEAWHEDANANLRSLKRDVGQYKSESVSYEKTMWERIETELEEINVENLGFDHPICSGVLDIMSEPFTNMPGSVSDIFKEPFRKYKLEQNHDMGTPTAKPGARPKFCFQDVFIITYLLTQSPKK